MKSPRRTIAICFLAASFLTVSFFVLSRHISSQAYQNKNLRAYGPGYLLYLPEGYEDNPAKTWPLIFFLHGAGTGDHADTALLLAKVGSLIMLRKTGPLPVIVIAPLIDAHQNTFLPEYLDGVLAEALSTYRVDSKRIYVTGASMGGKATYLFAIHRPDTLAAIAPLSAWLDADQVSLLDGIKNLPVWAIHGADDSIIALEAGERPVDALKKLGGNIRFTVLPGRDHDIWIDIYSDPAFYDWLMQHHKP